MQVSIDRPSNRTLLAQQIREEIEIIRDAKARHEVRAVFFCEYSHEGVLEAREIFVEEAQRADVFIGFGDDGPLGKSRYSVVGPESFFWAMQKGERDENVDERIIPSFTIAGVKIKVQICSNVGENNILWLGEIKPSVDLALNPCWTSGSGMRSHARHAGALLARAYLGINGVHPRQLYGGRSTFTTYDPSGRIIEPDYTPLGAEPGILIADVPVPTP